jgi:hypothetical protein
MDKMLAGHVVPVLVMAAPGLRHDTSSRKRRLMSMHR